MLRIGAGYHLRGKALLGFFNSEKYKSGSLTLSLIPLQTLDGKQCLSALGAGCCMLIRMHVICHPGVDNQKEMLTVRKFLDTCNLQSF